MRRNLISLCLLFISVQLSAQEDIDKLMEIFNRDTGITHYGNHPTAGKYYNIRGFKMYAETYGNGVPLLFIHGNGGSIQDFSFQIPFFSQKYKVIVADSRAQGRSKDTGDSLSYEMMADDYAALLTQMHIDSAYVVGWSDGGINGLLLAIRHPEKVKKLAVTGANLWPDTTAIYQDVISLVMPEYNSVKTIINRSPREKDAWKLLRLLIEEPHIALTDIRRISVPVLVMGGDHDVIRTEHTRLIAENISRSYLWILPNSGHSTPWVYRDEFNRKVDAFFQAPYRIIQGRQRFF